MLFCAFGCVFCIVIIVKMFWCIFVCCVCIWMFELYRSCGFGVGLECVRVWLCGYVCVSEFVRVSMYGVCMFWCVLVYVCVRFVLACVRLD